MREDNVNIAKESSDFIKFLINSTYIYEVDDENYIISKADSTRVRYKFENDEKKYIRIFTPNYMKDDDSVILNPYNETLKKTQLQKWFYTTLALSISMKLKKSLLSLVDLYEVQENLPIEQIKELSMYLNDITKKTDKEIEKITKELINFANIYYNKKLRLAYFRTGIFENSFIKKIKGVSKKTWGFIEKFISNIFDIDEVLDIENKRLSLKEKYSSKTNKITCPEFICFIETYFKVTDKINEKLQYLGMEDYIIDMSQFSYYLNKIDDYYNKTKWLSNSYVGEKTKQKEISSIIPAEVSNDLIPVVGGGTNMMMSNNNEEPSSIIPPGYNFNNQAQQLEGEVFPGVVPVYNTPQQPSINMGFPQMNQNMGFPLNNNNNINQFNFPSINSNLF